MLFSLHNDLYFSAPRLTSIDLYVPSLNFKTINNVPSGQKIPILILSTSYLYSSPNNVNPIIFLLYFFNLIFATRIPARKAMTRHTTNVSIFKATIITPYSMILNDTSVRLFIARCSSVSLSTTGLLDPFPTTTIRPLEIPFITK